MDYQKDLVNDLLRITMEDIFLNKILAELAEIMLQNIPSIVILGK